MFGFDLFISDIIIYRLIFSSSFCLSEERPHWQYRCEWCEFMRSFGRWGFYNRIVRIMHNPSHHKLSLVIGFLFLGKLAINPEVFSDWLSVLFCHCHLKFPQHVLLNWVEVTSNLLQLWRKWHLILFLPHLEGDGCGMFINWRHWATIRSGM